MLVLWATRWTDARFSLFSSPLLFFLFFFIANSPIPSLINGLYQANSLPFPIPLPPSSVVSRNPSRFFASAAAQPGLSRTLRFYLRHSITYSKLS